MKSLFGFLALAWVLAGSSSASTVGGDDIPEVLLPEWGGAKMRACIQGLLKNRLVEGQEFMAFNGTDLRGKRVAIEQAKALPPETHSPMTVFTILFTTPDREGWRYYHFRKDGLEYTGRKASKLQRIAVVEQKPSRKPTLSYPIDLTALRGGASSWGVTGRRTRVSTLPTAEGSGVLRGWISRSG